MNKGKIVIVGAGMHSAMLIEILEMNDFSIVGLTDPSKSKHGASVCGYPVLGGDEILPSLLSSGVSGAVVGIGGTRAETCLARKMIFEKLLDMKFSVPELIHPSAFVSRRAKVGRAAQILAGAIVQTNALLKDNVLINAGAIVEHDCVISNHAVLGSGAVLCGAVSVGEASHVGAGATVRQSVLVGRSATIAMGAAVIRDVEDFSTVLGVPARNKANEEVSK